MKKYKKYNKKVVKKNNYRIKSGDKVILITGKDKGKTGNIIFLDRKHSRVKVEGLNLVKKHKRPSQENEKGKIIDIPAPIHISNVMIYDSQLKKGVRVKIKRENGEKKRYANGKILKN